MAPLFDVRNLTIGYDTPLLRDISFSAEAGQIIGILGRNGSGKTTLLRGLSGSIRRFTGEILVNGQDCSRMTPKQQATKLSVLPQQTEILEGITARQLIEMGRYAYSGLLGWESRKAEDKILENARRLGILHLLDMDCAKLSQGQRQLAALCRLLVQNTPVLLLDEPNATLDYDNTFAMFRVLQDVVKNKTALLVLHDPELALAHCHRLLLVKEGGICRRLSLAQAEAPEVEEALRQLYPNIVVRKDPLDGRFRCYNP